jgi:methenyltetrahydrofolate cyclohydrolase
LKHSPPASTETSLLDLPVRELVERLGSAAPTPGGGAAAALVGALGAALVSMTAGLTLGRPKFAAVQDQVAAIRDEAAAAQRSLSDFVDADAAAFADVSASYRLPRGSDAERAARAAAIQSALVAAAQVPLETARACAAVLRLCERAAPVLNPAAISDVMVGAVLAWSALESAAINVEANLALMTDAEARATLATELEEVRAGASERLERVLGLGRARLGGV